MSNDGLGNDFMDHINKVSESFRRSLNRPRSLHHRDLLHASCMYKGRVFAPKNKPEIDLSDSGAVICENRNLPDDFSEKFFERMNNDHLIKDKPDLKLESELDQVCNDHRNGGYLFEYTYSEKNADVGTPDPDISKSELVTGVVSDMSAIDKYYEDDKKYITLYKCKASNDYPGRFLGFVSYEINEYPKNDHSIGEVDKNALLKGCREDVIEAMLAFDGLYDAQEAYLAAREAAIGRIITHRGVPKKLSKNVPLMQYRHSELQAVGDLFREGLGENSPRFPGLAQAYFDNYQHTVKQLEAEGKKVGMLHVDPPVSFYGVPILAPDLAKAIKEALKLPGSYGPHKSRVDAVREMMAGHCIACGKNTDLGVYYADPFLIERTSVENPAKLYLSEDDKWGDAGGPLISMCPKCRHKWLYENKRAHDYGYEPDTWRGEDPDGFERPKWYGHYFIQTVDTDEGMLNLIMLITKWCNESKKLDDFTYPDLNNCPEWDEGYRRRMLRAASGEDFADIMREEFHIEDHLGYVEAVEKINNLDKEFREREVNMPFAIMLPDVEIKEGMTDDEAFEVMQKSVHSWAKDYKDVVKNIALSAAWNAKIAKEYRKRFLEILKSTDDHTSKIGISQAASAYVYFMSLCKAPIGTCMFFVKGVRNGKIVDFEKFSFNQICEAAGI